ncbi:TIGR03842 family LLM class F420-dependent oxidoreductase [Isoptericola sp. NPDC057391]|uniref:TIGR03842 family LLM class F420-dependent oxidoreductase n=1 Tax=Isoptericola sp. NPDC057391 TaxID=3346117 RepID=UPI003628FECD
MDFGVVLQNDPPASRVVDLAVRAEAAGFSHVWTFDSHLLWQEPFVVYPAILAATERVVVGPMVTNPATRDWTVIASMFATLNEAYGNRTVCGIGRGDSAVRVVRGRPSTVAELREAVEVIRELGSSRGIAVHGVPVQLPWSAGSRLEVWVAAYGPRALRVAGEVGDGYILQLADPDVARWMIGAVRAAASDAGRDPDAITFCVAAPAYVTETDGASRAHAREQVRWFGGMVGNHVAEIVERYGTGSCVPRALTDYVAGRRGYDYAQHGRAGNPHAAFVPDEIVERFCLLGPPEEHRARLRELEELGVDQFAIYLQHDAQVPTLRAYGEHVVPAWASSTGPAGAERTQPSGKFP